MKKAYRVKSEADFQRVFHHGKSTANRQFVVYILNKQNQDHFRVGISVGKKIGNAVERNALKRKIRQGVLELENSIKEDIDFIVIARKPAANLSTAEVKKNLMHVFNIAQILIDENDQTKLND